MALPTLQRKLFQNDGYGPLLKDEIVSKPISIQDWSNVYDYSANTLVKAGGNIYRSVASSGPGTTAGAKDPAQDDGTYWKSIADAGSVESVLSSYATQSWVTDKGYAVDSNVVHKTGNEDVYGDKAFHNDIGLYNKQEIVFNNPDVSNSGTVTVDTSQKLIFRNTNGTHIAETGSVVLSGGSNNIRIDVKKYGSLSTYGRFYFRHPSDGMLSFFQDDDGKCYLGLAYHRWKQVYAASSTISTSDEREKSSISSIPDEVLDAWGTVNFAQFQFKDAIAEKGEALARLHSGLIAQRIDAAFKAAGLDASRYGLFCWDSWEAESDGDSSRPAGDRYSLRYEEALCMEAAYQRRRADRAEARIVSLEARLAALEAKLNG